MLLLVATAAVCQSDQKVSSTGAIARNIAQRLNLVPGDKARVLERGKVTSLDPDKSTTADEVLLVRPAPVQAVESAQQKFTTLPFKLQHVDLDTLATREFWPVIHPVRETLEYDAREQAFLGEVLVGMIDKTGVTTTTRLSETLTLQLVTSVGKAAPTFVAIDHVGPPFATVALRIADEVEELRLTILWGVEPDDSIERSFPLRRPKVDVSVSPSRIAGFGLAVADIVINANGAGSRGVKTAVVSHDRGRLEGTQQVMLDDQGFGVAHLRSVGVGTAKVRVTVPTFESSEQEIAFHWPIAFLVAAIGGGLIGGFVRYVQGGRRRVGLAIVRSALIGLVVAVGSAVGVNLLGIQLPTGIGEGFVFVVAALGALRGIKIPGDDAGAKAASAPASS